MNFLKKGPELKLPSKMPELKVPGFVQDAYYELDERHLLPLVIVLVVAIIAVPIALSESADTSGAANLPLEATATASATSPIVVAKSLPGLRDYHQRLQGLEAKDPFKQQFTDAENTGATGEGSAPVEETGGTEGSSDSSSGTGSGEGGTTHTFKYFSWTVDVRIVPVSTNGKPSKSEPTVRQNQPELTMFPGHDTPALIFMGPTGDGKKALMLVSSNVTALFGDAVCVLGGETCEMVALEEGVPETFIYGGNERVFRIELQKIELTATDKLNRAKLGQPKTGKGQAQREAALGPAVGQPK